MRSSWLAAVIPIVSCAVVIMLFLPYTPVNLNSNSSDVTLIPGVSAHNITSHDIVSVKNSNFQWIRINSWPAFGSQVEMVHISGLNVLCILGGTQKTADNVSAWSDWIYSYANNYSSVVGAWDIFNEPTVSFPSGVPSNMSTQEYLSLQEISYSVLKESSDNAIVLGFGGIRILDGTILDIGWVEALVKEGILEYCDAVSVHLYSTTSNAFVSQMNFHNAINNLRNIIGNKTIWITEIGQPSDMNPEAFINSVYPMLLSLGIQHIFWYEFRDWVSDFGHHFGLLQSDFTPRPAYYRMLEINREYAAT